MGRCKARRRLQLEAALILAYKEKVYGYYVNICINLLLHT